MDIKAKLQEYLDNEELLYVDIFMNNGGAYNLFQPQSTTTLNIELKTDYVRIYGDINDTNSRDVCIPYDKISHVGAEFGTITDEDTEEIE